MERKTISEAHKRANKKWNDANPYDRVQLVLPRGQKATLQAAADEAGESVNQYAQKAILMRMGRESWEELPQDER